MIIGSLLLSSGLGLALPEFRQKLLG